MPLEPGNRTIVPPHEETNDADLDNQHSTQDSLEPSTSGKQCLYYALVYFYKMPCVCFNLICLDHTSSEQHPLHQAAEGAQLVEAAEGPSLYGQTEGSSDSEEYITPPSSPSYDQVSLC